MSISNLLSSLVLLLLLTLISTSSSRLLVPQSSPSSPTTTANSTQKRGPIITLGKYYHRACDPIRFQALGLHIRDFAYCDKSRSYYDRVDDLIGRMRLEEKVHQISDYANGVDRIGLPEYKWWGEILHGVSSVSEGPVGAKSHATWFGDDVPGATSFPEVILSAAAFNESLWRSIGETVSTEARAMYNLGHAYLTFWSPVINLARDPRWGRIMETPGEDPFVIGTYSKNFVRGLQDIKGLEVTKDLNTRPVKVASCCKHFSAYDIDSWFGYSRFTYDSRVHEQDMVESFNLPFEMCITEGDSTSAMCSYNQVNGIPACTNPKLLTQNIREEWNLHGYVVSDCYIYQYIHDNQTWLGQTKEELTAKAINAGLDLECGWEQHRTALGAVKLGKLKEKEIDRALKNLYLVLMRVGFFDGIDEFDSLDSKNICTKEHMDLAADAARQGIVLLKNDNNRLPLNSKEVKNLAIGGTHYNATDAMKGNYDGKECRYVTPLDAFKAEAKVEAVEGCHLYCTNQTTHDQMKNAAKQNDATILFMGINTDIEAEFRDRINLTLPSGQIQFINEVAEASKNPIVLVLFSAGGLDVSFAKENPKIGAILWAGYPGEEGGQAIADVVYGRYNPGGRLPITWYTDDYTKSIPMSSMQFRPDTQMGYPGRTYKFYDGPVTYPFGYGLSYTQFEYEIKSNPKTLGIKMGEYQQCLPVSYKDGNQTAAACPSASTSHMPCTETVDFEVHVSNTGKMDGHDVVLVYAKPPSNVDGAPIKQLVAFERVFVKAGKTEVVKFSINACKRLSTVEKTAYRVLVAGEHTIVVGDEGKNASFGLQIGLSSNYLS